MSLPFGLLSQFVYRRISLLILTEVEMKTQHYTQIKCGWHSGLEFQHLDFTSACSSLGKPVQIFIIDILLLNRLFLSVCLISKCRHKNRFYVKSFCQRKNAVTSSLPTYQPVIPRMLEIINTNRSGTSLVA